MNFMRRVAYVAGKVLEDQIQTLLEATGVLPSLRGKVYPKFRAPERNSPWLTEERMSVKGEDGIVYAGFVPKAGAKFAIPKGLPLEEGVRTLAIENEPHTLEGFSGVIKEGYGKGVKTLLYKGTAAVKVKGDTFLSNIEYHVHDAERAGRHYDLAIEELKPGTDRFEVNIPNGKYQGRYAFNKTGKGLLVVRMKDRGIVHPKPTYHLRTEEYLKKLEKESPDKYYAERKIDGSLGNAQLTDDRVAFRSHRDTGITYYDRIPNLEFVSNKSPYFLSRYLFSGPKLDGTIFKGEIVHPDGSAVMSGILNSLPDNAQQVTKQRGNPSFFVWDIVKYKGKDLSKMPSLQRRILAQELVGNIRLFNKDWDIIEMAKPGETYSGFYERVVSDPLPWGEGIVLKDKQSPLANYIKLKETEYFNFIILEVKEGTGKYKDDVGYLIVQNPETGAIGKVGSFAATDEKRRWMWENREKVPGLTAKVRVSEITARGVGRAPTFKDFPEHGVSEELMLQEYRNIL